MNGQERGKESTLRGWHRRAADKPVYAYSFHDFVLDREQTMAGFDEALLPPAPPIPAAPPSSQTRNSAIDD
jgi:hypothetical protein